MSNYCYLIYSQQCSPASIPWYAPYYKLPYWEHRLDQCTIFSFIKLLSSTAVMPSLKFSIPNIKHPMSV